MFLNEPLIKKFMFTKFIYVEQLYEQLREHLDHHSGNELIYDDVTLFDHVLSSRYSDDVNSHPTITLVRILLQKGYVLTPYNLMMLEKYMRLDDFIILKTLLDDTAKKHLDHLHKIVYPQLKNIMQDKEICIDKQIYYDIDVLDYLISLHDRQHERFEYVLSNFLNNKENKITSRQLFILATMSQSINNLDLFKCIAENEYVKKLKCFKIMLYLHMSHALDHNMSTKVLYILSVPKYDIKMNIDDLKQHLCDVKDPKYFNTLIGKIINHDSYVQNELIDGLSDEVLNKINTSIEHHLALFT